jgi:hypothetical protein
VPPEAVIALLYATPTVPAGREFVAIVSWLGWTGVIGGPEIELQPAKNAAITTMRINPEFRMPDLSHVLNPTLPERSW